MADAAFSEAGASRPAVLAIDGGNSKTDVALVAADGTLLASARGPGINAHEVGVDQTVLRPTKFDGSLGPSVVAPSWMLPLRVSEPARLAISLCMQCGNTVPAPTTNVVPQALAPSAKFSCCCANEAN